MIEKRRRDRINRCLNELGKTVPMALAKQVTYGTEQVPDAGTLCGRPTPDAGSGTEGACSGASLRALSVLSGATRAVGPACACLR